jgi:hypothetical protein
MPIMAAHGLNDARGAARLLAKAAQDCISNPTTAPEREVALNNVFRLLETFRANQFFGLERPMQYPRRSTAKLSLLPPAERHVKEVRDVLEQAITVAFADVPKDRAIDAIEKVLRAVTYPESPFPKPSEKEKSQAACFFQSVAQRL